MTEEEDNRGNATVELGGPLYVNVHGDVSPDLIGPFLKDAENVFRGMGLSPDYSVGK